MFCFCVLFCFFASIIKGPIYIGVLSTITVGRLLPPARIQLYRVFVFHIYDKFYFRYVIYWTMGGFLNNFRRKPSLYSYKTQSLLAFQGTCMICASLCQRARTVLWNFRCSKAQQKQREKRRKKTKKEFFFSNQIKQSTFAQKFFFFENCKTKHLTIYDGETDRGFPIFRSP